MQEEIIMSANTLIACLIALFSAQLIKFLGYGIIKHEWDVTRLYSNGGMPSSHAALVSSLTVSVFCYCGFGMLFCICLVFSIIISHDAMNVRYESSKHAIMLNKLVDELNEDERKKLGIKGLLKERIGHKPKEVYAGLLYGILIALLMYLILK